MENCSTKDAMALPTCADNPSAATCAHLNALISPLLFRPATPPPERLDARPRRGQDLSRQNSIASDFLLIYRTIARIACLNRERERWKQALEVLADVSSSPLAKLPYPTVLFPMIFLD